MPPFDEEPVRRDVPENVHSERRLAPAEPGTDGNCEVESREGLDVAEYRIDDDTQPQREAEARSSNEIGRTATRRRLSHHPALDGEARGEGRRDHIWRFARS